MKNLVFLGGTVGKNPWRLSFIAALVALGVSEDSLFNPVVDDWNEAFQALEEEVKKTASHFVFYIADPMQEGNTMSGYSMVEATMALYDKPESTVVVFDSTGMSEHGVKALNQSARVLKARFPDANIFATREAAIEWFAKNI